VQYLAQVEDILESSVHGHKNAKRSIKQIVAQWITGESKGYCFGFEGPPGTGKTSLAKNGLSKCLLDINGEKRPFVFIALGGSSNGSTLEGHSYTYVGSTWGRIVDVLMETQCMNPIIYIDELDKISRTEQGRELIGILTHMTDSTQNDEFMDKYFAGIKIDLSKVLFVFSYNDRDLLDSILRDRIHVVKFDPLKQKEKHHVCGLHLIPEILRTVGVGDGDIVFPEEVIDFIIDNYTCEGGVRKLKEKLFDVCRELNIRHITDKATYAFPFTVTNEFLCNDIFVQCPIIHRKCILEAARIGLTNGMYASTAGVGGITIIECFVVPKSTFMALELTGQQGDVMKESMAVARTVAWNLIKQKDKDDLHRAAKKGAGFGLHLHCPDGGTPKDGPSAGAAITTSIVSCLLKVPVCNTVAMTGEIDLNGQVCQIGGLETKIRGAKKAGVKKVLVPRTNEHDLQSMCNGGDSPFADGTIEHVIVDTIWDVIPHVFPGLDYEFVHF
jgi:ATP-dependent Lon protease